MRTKLDDQEGFPVPRFVPSHPGAFTVHAIFASFPELTERAEASFPLYAIKLFQAA